MGKFPVAEDKSPFIAVGIEKTTRGVRVELTLNVNLDELGEPLLIEVENKAMDKVEPITDNDERQRVWRFSLFEELLRFLRAITVTLSADALDFTDLTCAGCSLDVVEVDLGDLQLATGPR